MLQAEQVLYERYQLKQKLSQNAGRQTWLCEDIATQEGLSKAECIWLAQEIKNWLSLN